MYTQDPSSMRDRLRFMAANASNTGITGKDAEALAYAVDQLAIHGTPAPTTANLIEREHHIAEAARDWYQATVNVAKLQAQLAAASGNAGGELAHELGTAYSIAVIAHEALVALVRADLAVTQAGENAPACCVCGGDRKIGHEPCPHCPTDTATA